MPQSRFNSDTVRAERVETSDVEGLYPIRTVSALTGVNPVTLRAWERRHGLIRPQRTPKGHRLYTEADIDRIHHLLVLLKQGIPIGQTRRLIDGASAAIPFPNRNRGGDQGFWKGLRKRLADAVDRFDGAAMDAVYSEALSQFPLDTVNESLMRPLLVDLRAAATAAPAQAGALHFLNAFLRNKLGARLHHQPHSGRGPKLLIAGMPGDPIDGELLLFTLATMAHGYRPVLLGPDVPVAALALAARQSQARAVVVFAAAAPADEAHRALADLAHRIDVRLFVAGCAAAEHERIHRAGGIPLPEDPGQGMAILYDRLGG